MPGYLELLAPARNMDIGIAAIDCGADAVYIAGPAFGLAKPQETQWRTSGGSLNMPTDSVCAYS